MLWFGSYKIRKQY